MSVTQGIIALSSTEAEFYASNRSAASGLQINFFLVEMNWYIQLRVWSDSSAGRGIMSRLGSGRVRHIEARYLWSQEALRAGKFLLRKSETDTNVADIGTKSLDASRLETLMHSLLLRTSRGSSSATWTANGIMALSILGAAEGTEIVMVGQCLAQPAFDDRALSFHLPRRVDCGIGCWHDHGLHLGAILDSETCGQRAADH